MFVAHMYANKEKTMTTNTNTTTTITRIENKQKKQLIIYSVCFIVATKFNFILMGANCSSNNTNLIRQYREHE